MRFWPFRRKRKPKLPAWLMMERMHINGQGVDVPVLRSGAYHDDGVPIGLRPGDPVRRENLLAIFDFVQREGRRMGDLGPGESSKMEE